MRIWTFVAGVMGSIVLAIEPATAQSGDLVIAPPGSSGAEVLRNPAGLGIPATTPSRLRSSQREMNRGRPTPFEVRMSPRQTKTFAEDLILRADIRCAVIDAVIVARTRGNLPVVEVDCAEGGGMLIADTLPIQATDCLDLAPAEGAEPGALNVCRLPANVAAVTAARQSSRN